MSDSKSSDTSSNKQWISLAAGGIAGGVEAAATYPFEFAKTQAQLRSDITSKNPFSAVGEVYKKDGFRALYKGCSSLIAGSVAKDSIRFLAFDTMREFLKNKETGELTAGNSLLSGMAAGVVASFTAVTPTERVKTALIDDARKEKRFRSTMHAVKLLVKENGLILGLYRGFVGTTLKQATATSVRLGSYNIIKEFEERHDIPQNTATNFANGSLAGTITVFASQPFDTLKTRGQSAKGASVVEAFTSVMKDYGIRGFWRGSVMRLGRVVFSGGILFTAYERVSKVLHTMFDKQPSNSTA